MLTACSTLKIVPETEPLPPIPEEYISCFDDDTRTVIPKGPWDKATVKKVVARLRKSEFDKTKCGQDFIAFYNDLASGLSTGK